MYKKTGSVAAPDAITYHTWIKQIEPHTWNESIAEKASPLISVIVPAFNTPDKYLLPLLQSLKSQTYANWELCLADGSTNEARAQAIQNACKQDERIRYKRLKNNQGIVGNTNQALAMASGEFVAFLDHDDMLAPQALNEVALVLKKHPKTDLVYSDEDKLSDDGTERSLPFFKPDWSPDLLLGVNYITHFVVARKSLVDKIGGLRSGFDGAQDYDFLLRATESTNEIRHIPKILYHWRLAEGSTAKDASEKDYADTAGQRALRDAVKRRKLKAEVVEIPERPTNYRLRFELPKKQPKVSIIIPFKDKVDLLKVCVPSILKSTYQNYEIILVSNNSVESDTFEYLESLKNVECCKIFEWNQPFNYSAVNNFGRSKASGEYLIFLNNDTEILEQSWLEELIGVASQKEIGAVGPLLLYPNKTIQHAGVVLGMGGMAGHVFRHHLPTDWTDFGIPVWPRNYLAITGACLAVQAHKFDEVGGLDEKLTIGGNDVALCLSLYEKGYRNVYWPFAPVIHYENVSVGPYTSSVPLGDYNRSLEYYKPYHENGDPYFNPNLDLMNEQIGLRSS